MLVQDWAESDIVEYSIPEEQRKELDVLLEAFVKKAEEMGVPAFAMYTPEVTIADSLQYSRTSLPEELGKIPPEMVAIALTVDNGLLGADNQDIYGRLVRTQFDRITKTAKKQGREVIDPNKGPIGSKH